MRIIITSIILSVYLITPAFPFWQPAEKKLIHAGYPAEVAYIRQHIDAMKELPFDGTIFAIHELRPLFNYERKIAKEEVQSYFDDVAATDWGRVSENFLLMQVEQMAEIDWYDDEQWEIVEHNLRLSIDAVVAADARGIIFDPEQYNYRLWKYEKAKHIDAKTYEEYFNQLRKRGAQWMNVAQSVKPDIRILHYYMMTAFSSYYGVKASAGSDPVDLLAKGSYGLYLGFINGMLDAAGSDVVFIDGNEPAYYYGTRAAYDEAFLQIKQERLYLIAPENRERFRRQVQVGSSLYIQGTFGMRNYSIQALGAFLDPEGQLKLLEHRAYQALRTADEYVWCYSDSKFVNWFANAVPAGAANALASARSKIATGEPLGFSEEPFEEVKRQQQEIMINGRASIVPLRAEIKRVGASGPPVIDGNLDDAIWRSVKHLGPFQVPNIYKKDTLQAPTTAQVAWDDENLYAAFTCREPDVEKMSRRKKENDSGVWNDDCVEVFISAAEETIPYRHFMANSLDTHFDASWIARKKMDASWGGEWMTRSVLGEEGWTIEFAIPWALIGSRPNPGDERRANVTRHRIPHEEETTTWTPMYKTFSDTEFLGTWVFQDSGP